MFLPISRFLPIPPILSESASTKLSAMLGRPAGGKLVTAEYRMVIGQVCDDAKASGLSIEQIIIALKSVFEKIPGTEGSGTNRAEIRDRVIAVCIEEYYRDGKSALR